MSFYKAVLFIADDCLATNNKSTDPFTFVMIDGDPHAYDESLVD